MEYTFEKPNKDKFNNYFDYLLLATRLEPECMCSSDINKEELYEKLDEDINIIDEDENLKEAYIRNKELIDDMVEAAEKVWKVEFKNY